MLQVYDSDIRRHAVENNSQSLKVRSKIADRASFRQINEQLMLYKFDVPFYSQKKDGHKQKGGEHTARTIKDCDSDIMKQKYEGTQQKYGTETGI